MAKRKINNISSVGIIYRDVNPAEIFIEVKDDGHPIKLVRRQLCFIGGNWIGKSALQDKSTLDTFRRELDEELSFDRPIRDTVELSLLGQASLEKFEPAPAPAVEVTEEDINELERLKRVMASSAVPYCDVFATVSKLAMDLADPTNQRETFSGVCSYWKVPLTEVNWFSLVNLQEKFKNLSNESITIVTSLSEIVANGVKVAFGHDRTLQRFFLEQGFDQAKYLRLVPHIESEVVGMPLNSYQEYLEMYEVAKRPA